MSLVFGCFRSTVLVALPVVISGPDITPQSCISACAQSHSLAIIGASNNLKDSSSYTTANNLQSLDEFSCHCDSSIQSTTLVPVSMEECDVFCLDGYSCGGSSSTEGSTYWLLSTFCLPPFFFLKVLC
ncbi:hypothetical protein BJ741DRAFT_597205 [Chytriomyces cf. hyalinus JEL632]|nr:hypothetical protein BJ741DRAFT_597205 [Chytriomyces cf. hyalinus JEL632]